MQRSVCRYQIFDPFDRQPGNGSREAVDDILDDDSIFDNEWGSAAATTFDPNGTDAKGNDLPDHRRDKLRDLYAWHNGKWEGSRKGDIRWSHIRNDTETFCSILELSELERERVLTLLEELDLSSNNFSNQCYESVVLGLCTLISDESLSARPDPSIDDRLICRDEFQELMDVTDTTSADLRSIRPKIRTQLDYFEK
jgi:hypothetical protein